MTRDSITKRDPFDDTDACVDGICAIPQRGAPSPQPLSDDVEGAALSATSEETIHQMSDAKNNIAPTQ